MQVGVFLEEHLGVGGCVRDREHDHLVRVDPDVNAHASLGPGSPTDTGEAQVLRADGYVTLFEFPEEH